MSKETTIEPGIRGWLIILTIIMFAAPGNFMAHAVHIASEFDSPVVSQFIDPSSPTYDSRWAMFIFSESSGFAILGAVSIFLIWPLFFLRHRLFRLAFAFDCVAVAALLVFRATLAAIIPTVAQAHRSSIFFQTVIWLPVSVALAIYVIRSRRSQITFKRQIIPYPAFPFFTRV
jgi:hypothetical protein